jgi:hypothetical protein
MRKKSWLLIFLAGFVFLVTPWARADVTLEEIREAIKKKGAKWEAGETWISRLSPEERKKFLGDIPVKPPPMLIEIPLSGLALPDSFDWRDHNGSNWMSPITDQSDCGNCWAHAACGAIEGVTRITLNEPDAHIDLSELYLTSCSGRGCDLGWDQSNTLDFISYYGVVDQSCFPGNLPPAPCEDACPDKFLRSIYVDEWWHHGFGSEVDPEDVDVIKDRIFNYGPVTVHFQVYEDFFNYHMGVYEHVSGDPSDWHAVSLVGWNDQDSCWVGKNSWGTDWGEDGWFRIRMRFAGVHIDEEIWCMTVDSASIPRIRVKIPSDEERWLVGTNEYIKWTSPYFVGNVKIEYSTNSGSTWDTIVDTTLDDGSYVWSDIPDTPSKYCKVKISDVTDGIPEHSNYGEFYIIPYGDVNADVDVNISDVVYLINYVLKSGPEPYILESGNVNCDWFVDLLDIIFLIDYVLKGGPRPEC